MTTAGAHCAWRIRWSVWTAPISEWSQRQPAAGAQWLCHGSRQTRWWQHRKAQAAERLQAGKPTEDGLIFVSPEGRPINRSWLGHEWARIADRAGVDVTFHGLRHGQASLLVALGVQPKVISERLGHSTIAMTMDRYAHVTKEADRDAARQLDKALRQKVS